MWGGGGPSQQARSHRPLLYPSLRHPPPPSLAQTLSASLLGHTSSPTPPPTLPGSPLLQAPLYMPLGLRPSLILSLHTHSGFLSLQQVSQAAVTPGPAWQLGGGGAALGLSGCGERWLLSLQSVGSAVGVHRLVVWWRVGSSHTRDHPHPLRWQVDSQSQPPGESPARQVLSLLCTSCSFIFLSCPPK